MFYKDYFDRFTMMLTQQEQEKLFSARVLVFGVGGVGSVLVHMLARSGIQHIGIVDFDDINSEATYYILALKTNDLNGSIYESFDHDSIQDFVGEYNGLIYEFTESKISIDADVDEQYTVCLVGCIEGYYYFSDEVTYSIKDVVNYYFDNNILTDQVMIDVLSTLL